jgi:hypothetical protein
MNDAAPRVETLAVTVVPYKAPSPDTTTMPKRAPEPNSAGLQRDILRRESNMTRSITLLLSVSIAVPAGFGLPARAQDVLPRPEQTFKGHIGRTVGESTKDFPQEIKAPRTYYSS